MKQREIGLDIIKALATLFVVCAHFYLSCKYYQYPIASNKMYVMTTVRWGFMTAVPLFLLTTGYLKGNKTVSKAHYMSLVPILVAYIILCSVRMIVENAVYGQIHTLSSAVKNLLNYNCAWYVGMYIGLMLICPFLNMIWKACGKKEHIILVASLIIITMMYPLVNYVFPSYFQPLYPITYYFMGIYLKEYRPKVNKTLLVIVFGVSILVTSGITIIKSAGGPFNGGTLAIIDNGQNDITIAIAAVCIFLFFYDINVKNKIVSTLITSASNCSLEIYMLQAAFNAVIYTYLGRMLLTPEDYFWWFFVAVPAAFIPSWIVSEVYKKTYSYVIMLFKKSN